MNKVTVEKYALIKVLEANRKEHQGKFLEAQKVYKRRVIQELQEQLDRACRGDKVSHYINLPMPENHIEDYDTVLKMLDMEVLDMVELTQREFKCFVEDEWDWVRSFAENSLSYLAKQ